MKSLFLKLLAKFAGVSPEFWALLEPVLIASAKTFLSDAVTIALPLVVSLEGLGLPSAEKRGEAINALIAAFLKDGKALDKQVAALAVEFALQHVRVTGVVAPSATPPPVPASLAATEAAAAATQAGQG